MRQHKNWHSRKMVFAIVLSVMGLYLTGCEEINAGIKILLPDATEFFPALVVFIIIFIVLAKMVWPSVLDTMDKREQKIEDDLDEAERAKADAAAKVEESRKNIAKAREQADEIVAKAQRAAGAERSRIIADAQADAADILKKARDTVESERRKAMIELSSSVVDLSVEIAGKIIGNELTDDQQRRLAEKYLAEVGKSDEQ